ncbi:MAG: UvrD-helicase domain-containing protein, partial [Cocleimonas sp.]
MQTLNPYTIPLESINLIEASAGTGKSWTVSLLVLRFILEKELTLDQILVVTFTEAATKELRDAVRKRLIEALSFFTDPSQILDQKEYETLYSKQEHGTDELAIQRLKRAKLSIDESAIFTIHSFCQRALTEYAFEAGLPFESELMDSDAELMQQLTDDFWRRNFKTAPQALLFKLQYEKITPDSLLQDIRHAVGKPYLKLCGPSLQTPSSVKSWQDLDVLFKHAMKIWSDDGCDIAELVFSKDLNGRSYGKATVEKNCQQMRG